MGIEKQERALRGAITCIEDALKAGMTPTDVYGHIFLLLLDHGLVDDDIKEASAEAVGCHLGLYDGEPQVN